MAGDDTKTALARAANDLTFPSESDEPWEAFAWPDAKGEPTADEVRKRGKPPHDSPVEERTLDELFQPLTEEQDWFGDDEIAIAAKNKVLFGTVKRLLGKPRVFRFGKVQIAVFVVGNAREGGWAGLKTLVIET